MIITYDFEFLERGADLPIMPISLGMVREDGQRLYLINGEMQLSAVARHPWLLMNVVPYLPLKFEADHIGDYSGSIIEWDPTHEDYRHRVGLDEMRHRILEFCDVDDLELWGWYCDFDHVVLSQLFGTFADHPPQLPMYSNDLVQEWQRRYRPQLPIQNTVHHALRDAEWIMETYQVLAGQSAHGVSKHVDVGDGGVDE